MNSKPKLQLIHTKPEPEKLAIQPTRLKELPAQIMFLHSCGIPFWRAVRLAIADWLIWWN